MLSSAEKCDEKKVEARREELIILGTYINLNLLISVIDNYLINFTSFGKCSHFSLSSVVDLELQGRLQAWLALKRGNVFFPLGKAMESS
jgi:hypothetical protein